jgi:hypothetical protein
MTCFDLRLVLPIAVSSLVPLAPAIAEACGGVFCDAGPQSMPVDQSGENILFVLEDDRVETHIQIQYEGDPAKFGWVIPLTAVPDFSIGSDALFQSLLTATVPTYGFTTTMDDCRPRPGFGGARDDSVSFGGEGEDGGGDTGDPGGPDILLQETVGAFDIVVLSGGDVTEVIAWLDENGYQQDPDAAPILEEYLQEGLLFGAIKLTGGAGVDQIHPIVLSYEGTEPCVPLRLTRIAATEDMDVRTFFLSEHRVVPTNYRHVLVNPLKVDWLSVGANYKEAITAAVDAEHADGRAFVTEYAGPSQVVPQDGLLDPRWNAEAFLSRTALEVVDELEAQGLVSCPGPAEGCLAQHPLIEALAAELLLPAGVSLGAFHECPECFVESSPYDPQVFSQAIAERIIAPGQHAQALLARWPYVTRMYTTISPHEMIADPMFHENADLSDVPNVRTADRLLRCNGDSVFTLPDGREVYLPQGSAWPAFQGEMPWDEEVTEIPAQGAPMELADKTEEIDELLAAYNADLGWPLHGCAACRVSGRDRRGASLPLLLLALGVGGVVRRRRT